MTVTTWICLGDPALFWSAPNSLKHNNIGRLKGKRQNYIYAMQTLTRRKQD